MPLVHGYVGLGSNLGDRAGNLRAGLSGMARRGLEPDAVSRIWESAPRDSAAAPWYLNMVARVDTALGPREVLRRLLEVERDVGRRPAPRNAPRVLDLDLLLLGDRVVEAADLVLPHPRMWSRRFVLAPLADLDPELRHPVTGRTVAEQASLLRSSQPAVPLPHGGPRPAARPGAAGRFREAAHP